MQLKNNRLTVNFATREEYSGPRFDQVGMIKSVTLDDTHSFHSKESLISGEGSNGQGFYNEFGLEEPIGYDDILKGEKFLKIGVGSLTKHCDEPYDFFEAYPIELCEIITTKKEDAIIFNVAHQTVNGYAVNYQKKIQIKDNELIITYTLENIGTKAIETTEYCHNFIAINGQPIGPDYELNFSYPIEFETKLGTFESSNKTIHFLQPLESVIYGKLKNIPVQCNQYFEVIHKPSGVRVRETSLFELHRVAIWGMPHVISPEAFINISLQPKETKVWQRLYLFDY